MQIGCGNSYLASENRSPIPEDISVDLFIHELRAVRQALGLERHHVLGHGWGGMLALSSLGQASQEERQNLMSLTLVSTPPSQQQLILDRKRRVGHAAWSYLKF
jgi:pimeloyl-ACP methyl ester carboxylesterase